MILFYVVREIFALEDAVSFSRPASAAPIFTVWIYWRIISYENITELYSNVKIILYPIFEYHSGHS